MADVPPFVKSERAAVNRLCKLKLEFGDVTVHDFYDRNEKGEITQFTPSGVLERDEEAIHALGDLKALRRFSADGPFVCDLLFDVLSRLPCLEDLTVWNEGHLTDAGVCHLVKAQRLAHVDIRGSRFSDAALESIGRIRTLTRLELQGGESFTNDGLRHLSGLSDLHMLKIDGPLIDDEGLVHLGQLKELTWLSLDRTRIRGRGMAYLHTLKKLTHLTADESLFDDEGLATLDAFPKLKYLRLRNARVTDAGIPHLERIPRLTTLGLTGCRITVASVVGFARCVKLKTLSLEDTAFTSAARKELKSLLPRCAIDISDVGDVRQQRDGEADDAPWEDAQYFWKHPPECLSRFKLTKKRGKNLDKWSTRFQLACLCGYRKAHVLGYPLAASSTNPEAGDVTLFVGPLSFRCAKCENIIEIIDTDDDGYNGRLGCSSVYRGEGRPVQFTCPECNGVVWQVQCTVVMNDSAFDLWQDDPEIALENYFDAFELVGTCAACDHAATIAWFDELA